MKILIFNQSCGIGFIRSNSEQKPHQFKCAHLTCSIKKKLREVIVTEVTGAAYETLPQISFNSS